MRKKNNISTVLSVFVLVIAIMGIVGLLLTLTNNLNSPLKSFCVTVGDDKIVADRSNFEIELGKEYVFDIEENFKIENDEKTPDYSVYVLPNKDVSDSNFMFLSEQDNTNLKVNYLSMTNLAKGFSISKIDEKENSFTFKADLDLPDIISVYYQGLRCDTCPRAINSGIDFFTLLIRSDNDETLSINFNLVDKEEEIVENVQETIVKIKPIDNPNFSFNYGKSIFSVSEIVLKESQKSDSFSFSVPDKNYVLSFVSSSESFVKYVISENNCTVSLVDSFSFDLKEIYEVNLFFEFEQIPSIEIEIYGTSSSGNVFEFEANNIVLNSVYKTAKIPFNVTNGYIFDSIETNQTYCNVFVLDNVINITYTLSSLKHSVVGFLILHAKDSCRIDISIESNIVPSIAFSDLNISLNRDIEGKKIGIESVQGYYYIKDIIFSIPCLSYTLNYSASGLTYNSIYLTISENFEFNEVNTIYNCVVTLVLDNARIVIDFIDDNNAFNIPNQVVLNNSITEMTIPYTIKDYYTCSNIRLNSSYVDMTYDDANIHLFFLENYNFLFLESEHVDFLIFDSVKLENLYVVNLTISNNFDMWQTHDTATLSEENTSVVIGFDNDNGTIFSKYSLINIDNDCVIYSFNSDKDLVISINPNKTLKGLYECNVGVIFENPLISFNLIDNSKDKVFTFDKNTVSLRFTTNNEADNISYTMLDGYEYLASYTEGGINAVINVSDSLIKIGHFSHFIFLPNESTTFNIYFYAKKIDVETRCIYMCSFNDLQIYVYRDYLVLEDSPLAIFTNDNLTATLRYTTLNNIRVVGFELAVEYQDLFNVECSENTLTISLCEGVTIEDIPSSITSIGGFVYAS